jgi:hypothetical protein
LRLPFPSNTRRTAGAAIFAMKKTLYGIPNCDTVKKARTWLADHGQDV